jgi:NAD(P) transhydrogenase subunit alpha
MPEHASELYARNVAALLEHMLADGVPDLSDEILAACCVTSTSDQLTEAR